MATQMSNGVHSLASHPKHIHNPTCHRNNPLSQPVKSNHLFENGFVIIVKMKNCEEKTPERRLS